MQSSDLHQHDCLTYLLAFYHISLVSVPVLATYVLLAIASVPSVEVVSCQKNLGNVGGITLNLRRTLIHSHGKYKVSAHGCFCAWLQKALSWHWEEEGGWEGDGGWGKGR